MAAASVTTVASALEGCARELADLAATGHRLQEHLSPLLQRADDVAEAQALDLLTQSLAALADYLTALAADVPPDARVDPRAAAAGLTLHALAERLSGVESHAAAPAGDLDFFGSA